MSVIIGSNALWTMFRDAIAERRDFHNSNKTLRGIANPKHHDIVYGQLSTFAEEQLRETVANHNLDFIVYSYNTPIAWHSDEGWVTIDDKFSATTSKHQGRIYTAISQLPEVLNA